MRGAVLAMMGLAKLASAAPTVVTTDVTETRACLPLPGGGALLGTAGGLALAGADGQVGAVFTAVDGLPGTRIDAIVPAGDALWIATDAGAARVTLRGEALTMGRKVDGAVRDVAQLGTTTYFATPAGVRAGARTLPLKGGAVALAVAGNALYAGAPGGLYQLVDGKLARISGIAAVTALYGDGDALWIGSPDGLRVRRGGQLEPIGGGEIVRIGRLDDAIVAVELGEGLVRVDRGRLARIASPRGLVMTLAAHGSAACAGGLDGAWLRSKTGWTAVAKRSAPPSNDISALAVDGDALYAGTFDHGLAVRRRGAWRTIAGIDRRINALYIDRAHRVWAATASGLYSYDGKVVTRMSQDEGLPTRSVLAVAGTRDGRLLVGTSRGAVAIANGRVDRLGPKDTAIGNVWAFAETPDGALWLGTTTGLYRSAGDTWQRFAMATGQLRDDWVTALAVRDGEVYAGTYHGGITKLDRELAASQVGDGWINPGGLTFDGDRLLAATMDGLYTGTTAIGPLPGKDTTAALRVGGALVVATRRGLVELPRDLR
jgi:two component regulator with propeller domain